MEFFLFLLSFLVIALLAGRLYVRRVMIRAQALGMTDGNFVFISFEVNISYDMIFRTTTWKNGTGNADSDKIALEAFRSLLVFGVVVDFGSDYEQFTAEVRRRMSDPPFNIPQNQTVRYVILSFVNIRYVSNLVMNCIINKYIFRILIATDTHN